MSLESITVENVVESAIALGVVIISQTQVIGLNSCRGPQSSMQLVGLDRQKFRQAIQLIRTGISSSIAVVLNWERGLGNPGGTVPKNPRARGGSSLSITLGLNI